MSGQHFQLLERYILGSPIASGGMATVYLGRPLSLPRVVAIKRLQPDLARDRAFVRMFLDEVQLLCRIRHKNVVAPIEHFQHDGEFFIVMEYVEGLSLAQLCGAGSGPVEPRLASKLMRDVLIGLDAAHEAVDCAGQPLNIVHRDVSPHNILVGTDGETRIVDFGIAKAAWRAQVTQHGELKGKPGYMAPEQMTLEKLDRRTDVYAAGIVLWELLTGARLFRDRAVRFGAPPSSKPPRAPSTLVPGLTREIDEVVLGALAPAPQHRFPDARTMADALSAAAPPARDFEVGAWVAQRGRDELEQRAELIAELERVRPSEVTRMARLPGDGGPRTGTSGGITPSAHDPPGVASGKRGPSNQPTARAADAADHRAVSRPMAIALVTIGVALLGASYFAGPRAPIRSPDAPRTHADVPAHAASQLEQSSVGSELRVDPPVPQAASRLPSAFASPVATTPPTRSAAAAPTPRLPPSASAVSSARSLPPPMLGAGADLRDGLGPAASTPAPTSTTMSPPLPYDPLRDARRR